MKKTYCGASFTIEAAVVVPIAMAALLAVLYVTFLLHDHTVTAAAGSYALLEHAQTPGSGLAEAVREHLAGRLILADGLSVTVTGNEKQSAVCITDRLRPPMPFIRHFLMERADLFTYEAKASDLHGRKTLLPWKALLDGAKGLILKKES